MNGWLAGWAIAALIFSWAAIGMIALGFIPVADKWLRTPGTPVRLGLWIGTAILATVTLISPDGSLLGSLRSEAISMALAVIVIDELNRHRASREFKEATIRQIDRASREFKESMIRQLGSRSNDFALDAARIVVYKGWHEDGSLKQVDLRDANLKGADLVGAHLEGATYSRETMWPEGFPYEPLERC